MKAILQVLTAKCTAVQLIGVDGNPVTLKCVNYFGFNNGQTMFDGLYAGSTDLSKDYGEVIYRIQVLYTKFAILAEQQACFCRT